MQKTTILLMLLIGAVSANLVAQNVWQKTLPLSTHTAAYSGLAVEGDRYLMYSSTHFSQWDQRGIARGYVAFPGGATVATAVLKRYNLPEGHPYFLVARRSLVQPQQYTLAEYRPGIGWANEYVISDSLGAAAVPRPFLFDLPDGAVLAVGRQAIRKLSYSPTQGFLEWWTRPLGISATAAVLADNGTVLLGDDGGTVVALDESGAPLWSRNHDMVFRGLATVPGGHVGCGHHAGSGVILRMDAAGAELWRYEAPDADYFAVTGTSDGGIVATGVSDALHIVLVRLAANGSLVWQQEYDQGTGMRVLQDTDGGFVLTARFARSHHLGLLKTTSDGQTTSATSADVYERTIATNGVQATLYADAQLFLGKNLVTAQSPNPVFSTLPDSGMTTQGFGPWIGGEDDAGHLHLAVSDYAVGSKRDFRPGTATTAERDFRRVWTITRADIRQLRLDYETDKTLDDPVPFDLLTWPGKGNPHLRYNLDFTPVETDPDLFPAPFVDANNDGIYNVYDGDYPQIKGDAMAWWVLTDSTPHTRSNGKPLEIDLLVSVYAFDCPQTIQMDQSLFVAYEMRNRSARNYQNMHFGIWADPDMGCPDDDALGSLPAEQACYVYNANAFDGGCGPYGLGHAIPVETIAFLDRPMDGFVAYNNPAVGQHLTAMSDPQQPFEFFNYLQGNWRDGTAFTAGAAGYNPGSTQVVSHLFPDNPADGQGWTMCTANLGHADRRMLATHGPFDLAAGDTFRIEVALTIHPDIPHPCPDVFTLVRPAVAQLRQWADVGALATAPALDPIVHLPPGQSATLDAAVPGAIAYLWSTGATSPSIGVAALGNYTVTVTAATGCQWVEQVVVQLGTPVLPPTDPPAFRVLPNPAQTFLQVDCPGCPDDALRAELYNAHGVLVRAAARAGGQLRLDAHGLPAGVYAVLLWQGGQFVGSRRVAIARGGE